MCDLKRRSLKLTNVPETEEFRRTALRRKPRGIKGQPSQSELSSGVSGSYECATSNDTSHGSEVSSIESRDTINARESETPKPQVPAKPAYLTKGRQPGSNHSPIPVELGGPRRETETPRTEQTESEANPCLYDNAVKYLWPAKSPLGHGPLREGTGGDCIDTLVPLNSRPISGEGFSHSPAKEMSRHLSLKKGPTSWLNKQRSLDARKGGQGLVECKSGIVPELIERWDSPANEKNNHFPPRHLKRDSVLVNGGGGDKRTGYNKSPSSLLTPSTETRPTIEQRTLVGSTEELLKDDTGTKNLEKKESRQQKLYKIAMELLHTERAYVARLYLLDKVFCVGLTEEAAKGSFPVEVVRTIFSNISSIHSFHCQFLLPDLETRMSQWWETPRLGDVMQQHAPFLRMYAEYVSNFDQAMELLRHWTDRSAAFRNIILDIQSKDVCGSLTLQHHMLEPVQRVPRYEMLFKDYMGKLSEEDMDFTYAQKSLQTISMAAVHANSAILKTEKLKKLLEIYEMLGDEEVVNPSNEFLKDGRLKQAAKNTSATDRHLFLFNNMVLCCTPRLSLGGQRFTVRTRIGIRGMHVQQMTNVDNQYSFQVTGKGKALYLQASSDQERGDWVKAIQEAIDVFNQNNETFKLANQDVDVDELTEYLGWRAPCLIRDNDVTMCMKCQEPFNNLSRRKHHCRACGCVVCSKCSDYKVALEYDGNKMNRVCRDCFSFFTGQDREDVAETKKRGIQEVNEMLQKGGFVLSKFALEFDGNKMKKVCQDYCSSFSGHDRNDVSGSKRRGIQEVKQMFHRGSLMLSKFALEYDGYKRKKVCKDYCSSFTGHNRNDVSGSKRRGIQESETVHIPGTTVMCGFLQYADELETWTNMWCVIPRNEPLALHLYDAPQSAKPLFRVPLLGSSVEDAPCVSDLQASFRLFHSNSVHTFTCDSQDLKQYWLDVIRVAAKRPSIRGYLALTILPVEGALQRETCES